MKKNRNNPPLTISYRDDLMRDLKNFEVCVGYLNGALEENDDALFLVALHNVVDAQGGISRLARLSKIHRVTLHRILSRNGNPKLENLNAILDALGFQFEISLKKSHRLKKSHHLRRAA